MRLTAGELAKKLEAKLIGDENVVIEKISEVEDCEAAGTLVVAVETKALKKLQAYKNPQIVILKEDIPELQAVKLIVARGKDVLISVLNIFYPEDKTTLISPQANIDKKAMIGRECRIYPGAYVGPNATIGDGTILYPNAVIYEGCRVGKNCIIHANAVIGADGFGFIQENGEHIKVPQKGIVIIGDNVEVGAGTTIDRATLKATVVGDGTKIDNKVQIGHNVRIGKNCILVAGANIGGSTILEDDVILAGGAGIVDNVTIGKGSIIYAYTVATTDLPAGSKCYGTPAGDEYQLAMKRRSLYNKLPELAERLDKLTKPKNK